MTQLAHPPVRIIYIGGSVRSGSTIVDMLMGTNTAALAIGEANLFFRQVLKTSHPVKCSCGETLRECALWSQVLERFRTALPNITLEQADAITRAVEGFPRRDKRVSRYWDDYVTIWRVLLGAIGEIGDVTTIIDSSKTGKQSLLRPLSLAQAGFDVSLLHMMRDPRAVTWSDMRRDLSKGHLQGNSALFTYAFRSALRWSLTNIITYWLYGKRNRLPYYRVRYEDFMEHPAETFREVEQRFQIDLTRPIEIIQSNGYIDAGHLASGNELRFKAPLRLQKQPPTWKSALPTPAKLGLVASLPAALYYRYRVTDYG